MQNAPPPTGFIEVDGARLAYDERGTGEAILCIHGAGSSAELWIDAVERLGRIGRALAYDRRGYGRNAPPTGATMDVARHAEDAADLLEALAATPAVVIARSYGGEVALALALRHPRHVRALVLLEGAPVEVLPEAAAWTRSLRDRLRALAAEHGAGALGRGLIDAALGEGVWPALPEAVRRVFAHNGAAALADLEGRWLDADPAALATIAQPALLVAATDSLPELREPNDALAAVLPDARTALVAGGHLIDPAAPEVIAFVREVLGGRAAGDAG